MKRIYVGNLPWTANDATLRSLFEGYGEVKNAYIATDQTSGHSRAFGFVEMPFDEEARTAIRAVNGRDYQGFPLVVEEA